MSASEIERFNADVQASEEMQKELVEAGSGIGSVVAFANARGYDFSAEDVRVYIASKMGHELTDEQLDRLAGAGNVHTHTNINTNTNVSTHAETSSNVVATQNAAMITNVAVTGPLVVVN